MDAAKEAVGEAKDAAATKVEDAAKAVADKAAELKSENK
ncbi:hypothetical protein N561_04800 [Gallibacterium anatis 12656/12]|uniref:Uncharacterized protein n=1 Tax=Gallibacterium anatis 12656/12 TaxID=1195244 RepID=U1H2R7_9PAST|nr:hypothetical protein N561_04800 [Gallibacterium anatis 12656/12]